MLSNLVHVQSIIELCELHKLYSDFPSIFSYMVLSLTSKAKKLILFFSNFNLARMSLFVLKKGPYILQKMSLFEELVALRFVCKWPNFYPIW